MLTAMGDVMREAHRRGWITTRDGNVSVFRRDKFYITPSAVRKYIIQPEHIIKMRVDTQTRQLDVPKGVTPSIEMDMHWNIHKDRGKLGSVVHLHPTHTIAAMLAGFSLQKLALEFPELGRYTKVGRTVTAYAPGTQDLAICTAKNIQGCDIVGQDRHGVTAVARNPWDAFEHIERLEHICEIVLKSGVQP